MNFTPPSGNTGMNMAPEKLKKLAEETNSILCFGIDPVKSRMNDEIVPYFSEVVDALLEENLISAIKPNYAYFAAEGFDGLFALKEIIDRYKPKTFVILDAKRGDIGKSSEAYASEAYDFWGADAVTLSPYMGEDSVKPFLRDGKLPYLLGRTSNPGAGDFQEPDIYKKVFRKAGEWGTGLVVGATSEAIPEAIALAGKETPLLVPGIGAQGGSFKTLSALRGNPFIHRVNSSSSIAYAHEKTGGSPAKSALEEAKKTAEKIKSVL
ncbi:orotidine-5'-phosphate decarboxylase [Candidatus Micrarchaeota archaeon]|nr:orotidine-5'-phosphate decarboxylase [Candidatus Micrarchaeota archaeon]MBD3418054.1 orotidine-5'-phosphate decarboxylase [Candidatus Micrarchaeota archaeon]